MGTAETLRRLGVLQNAKSGRSMEARGTRVDGHGFKPGQHTGRWIGCAVCGQPIGATIHILALAGMETSDREGKEARQQVEAAELTARLIEPRPPNIERRAGIMERESPLFYGTGDNPALW